MAQNTHYLAALTTYARAFLVAAACAGAAASAHATVLLNSLNPASVSGADIVPTQGPLADSFTIGANGSVGQITLLVSNPDQVSGYLNVSLVGDDGEPAPVGGTAWSETFAASLIGTTATEITLYPAVAGLAPGSRYWVELSTSGTNPDTGFSWETTSTLSGTGVAAQYNFNNYNNDPSQSGDGVAANSFNNPYQICVSSVDSTDCGPASSGPSAPVVTLPVDPPSPPVNLPGPVGSVDMPEPAGITAFAASLMALFLVRRSRARG